MVGSGDVQAERNAAEQRGKTTWPGKLIGLSDFDQIQNSPKSARDAFGGVGRGRSSFVQRCDALSREILPDVEVGRLREG
jgi:hypothetical protein